MALCAVEPVGCIGALVAICVIFIMCFLLGVAFCSVELYGFPAIFTIITLWVVAGLLIRKYKRD